MASHEQLTAVLEAAATVLAHRQAHMLTVEEWAGLCWAVAACTGQRTADPLTERDLVEVTTDPPLPWDEAADGALPKDA